MRRRYLRAVSIILALTAAALWTAVRVRRASLVPPAVDQYLCRETLDPFFIEEKPGSSSFVAGRSRAIPFWFRMPKPPGIFRIFIVGPSVAQNLDLMRWGASSLAGRLPAGRRDVEVINCAMAGYNISKLEDIVSEIRGYSPDAVVVLSGNHERLSFDPCPSDGTRMQMAAIPAPAGSQTYMQKEHELGMRLYEAALRRIIRAAKAAQALVVVCTLPANVRDYPPRITSEQMQPWPAMEPRRLPGAIALLQRRLARSPRNPLNHYFLAKAYDRAGDFANAREHYEQSMELDFFGDRCSPSRNALIRSVAGSEGALLADLERVFMARAPEGLVGDPLIADAYHWHHAFDPMASRAILEAIAGGPPRGEGNAAPAVDREREYDLMDTSALNAFNLHLMWRGKEEICEEMISFLGRLRARDRERLLASTTKDLERNFGKMWWADREARDGRWPSYLYHLGETFRRQGDNRLALGFFNSAVKLSRRPFFLAHRALVLEALGRRGEGSADFCAALDGIRKGRMPAQAARYREYVLELARCSGSALSAVRCAETSKASRGKQRPCACRRGTP